MNDAMTLNDAVGPINKMFIPSRTPPLNPLRSSRRVLWTELSSTTASLFDQVKENPCGEILVEFGKFFTRNILIQQIFTL